MLTQLISYGNKIMELYLLTLMEDSLDFNVGILVINSSTLKQIKLTESVKIVMNNTFANFIVAKLY